VITRLAPTPSGFLHLGNAVNFQLVAWLASAHDGAVALRVDDMDATRARAEYVDDVFELLAWMGIAWDSGPRDRTDFDARWTLAHRRDLYRDRLAHTSDSGLELYACACSRSVMTGPAIAGCPGGCRSRALELRPGQTALRAHVPTGTTIDVAGRAVRLDEAVGDFVVWRRDDLPAYHLACVVEDAELAVTHVVRGTDLVESTAAQLFLAPHVGAGSLQSTHYLHHGLVTGPDGSKLSKSQLRTGTPLPRTDDQRALIRETAARLGEPLGIAPPR
jgi:glutamyl/glutaminyl-tRNA synthetase